MNGSNLRCDHAMFQRMATRLRIPHQTARIWEGERERERDRLGDALRDVLWDFGGFLVVLGLN